MICDTPVFKRIESFTVFSPPSVKIWIEAVGKAKCNSLRLFNVYDAFSSAIDFNCDDFLDFFKNQSKEFQLVIDMEDETAYYNAENLLKVLLSEHFESFKYVASNLYLPDPTYKAIFLAQKVSCV
uniref:DUF4325 domain-containing protein n=1 Tax=Panagrellus redivivus TaxID=6233 RepID=A0A7E4ZWV1_PANRE